MGAPAASCGRASCWLIMLCVLDSTVLIDFLRGRPAVGRVRALRHAGDVPATTAINVEEIVRGLRPSETKYSPAVQRASCITGGFQRCLASGNVAAHFRSSGVRLYQADCLVAAAAMVNDATLAAGNPKDFPMREVKIEHWPVGQ